MKPEGLPARIHTTISLDLRTWNLSFREQAQMLAWFGFTPPALIGILLLGGGWVIAGFRAR